MSRNALCDIELRRMYRRYNARWFDDALPEDVDVLFAPAPWPCYGYALKKRDDALLLIDPKYAVECRMWKMTLLHEMCHFATWSERAVHGAAFQTEMQRLALAGAFAKLW